MHPTALLFLAVILSPLFSFVIAVPTLNWPIQDQRPLIARVDSAYQWAIYPDTFSTTSGSLNYTTSTLPSWLTFDPISLAFYGSPDQADEGEIDITLTATDGSTTDSSFKLLVSSNQAPGVHTGFDTQIADPALHNFNTATALPSSDGVLLHPYYSFSMGFQQSTFRPGYRASRQNIYYSAYVRGTTSLPPWLNFDNQTVTFSGVAPSDGTYVIVVTGSDYWGYSAVQNGFTIQVSTAFIDVPENKGVGNITTVAGSNVNYKLDLSSINVNGQAVADTASLNVTMDLDDVNWLTFDA
jgi:axial budding pattern protein 2